ncbi:MAG: hypothetical protein WCJ95_21405 [Mariniphaga sp.]
MTPFILIPMMGISKSLYRKALIVAAIIYIAGILSSSAQNLTLPQGAWKQPSHTRNIIPPQTLSNLEATLIKLHGQDVDAASLGNFHNELQRFAKLNTDDRSKAFCYLAALWLNEQPLFNSKDDLNNLLNLYNSNNSAMVDQVLHYNHYLSVIGASLSSEGRFILEKEPIDKLTAILDIALKNSLAAAKGQDALVKTGPYRFLFDTKIQADEFVSLVLGSLPAKFDPIIGNALERLGKEYIQNKGISSSAYIVEFTCQYTGLTSENQNLLIQPEQSDQFQQHHNTQPRDFRVQPYINLWPNSTMYNKNPGSIGAGVSIKIF